MESFTFELKLVDAVTASGKKAAAAVSEIEKNAHKAQQALNFHKEIEKTEQALHKISNDPGGLKKFIHLQKELLEQRKKINAAIGKESFGEAFKEKISFGKLFSAAALADVFAEGLVEAIKLPIELFADGIKDAFKAIGKEQELRAGYRLTLGDEKGDEAREDAERFSSKTAFSASQVQEQMLPLFRAGIEGQDARTTYATATDLAARQGKGADPAAVEASVALLAKIQNKGGVSSRELANVGLGKSVPQFFAELGKTLHVSAKTAQKMAAKGEIDPHLIRNQITTTINAAQHGQAGTGGEEAGKSLFGRLNKLKEMPEEYFRKLVDSPALKGLGDALGGLLEKISPDSPTGKKVMAALESGFETLAGWISRALSEENIDAFFSGLGKVADVVESIASFTASFVRLWVSSDLIKIISGIGLAVTLATSPILAAVFTVAALAIAFERVMSTVKELGGYTAVWNDLKDFASSGGMGSLPAASKGNAGFDAMDAENKQNLTRAHSNVVSVNDYSKNRTPDFANNSTPIVTQVPINVYVDGELAHRETHTIKAGTSNHERDAHTGS